MLAVLQRITVFLLTLGFQTHVKGGYFLEEDIALFDAAFFKYSSDNAAAIGAISLTLP